jgi:hypothetical protein
VCIQNVATQIKCNTNAAVYSDDDVDDNGMMIMMTKGIIIIIVIIIITIYNRESKLNHRIRNKVLVLKFGWTMVILFKNCLGLRQNC